MKEDLEFWKRLIIKGLVTSGFTFFSILTTIGIENALEPSAVAGGLYVFAEAIKYYNIQPNKKIQDGTYRFLL